MTVSIAVVCEAPADRETITTLADRLILESAAQSAPWIDGPEALPFYRTWRGFRAIDPHLEWTDLKRRANEFNIVVRFRGARHPYSVNTYRTILVLAVSSDPVDAAIMVPDSDGDLDRLEGLEQARQHAKAPFPIAVGLAHTKRECWHIAGFRPEDDDELAAVAELRQQLGYDPWRRTEELTAKHDVANDKRSAKRVLDKLCRGDRERENRCLTGTPIDLLCERGAGNGLAAFIAELRTHIVPLVLGVQPHPTTG